MPWFELSENPDAVRNHYADPPELNPFVLRELLLYGHDATLTLSGELSRPPDSTIGDPSAVGSLALSFWNVTDVTQRGVLVDRPSNVTLSKSADGLIHITATAEGDAFSATCKSFDILSFSVYSDEKPKRNRKTLFSYHNVWNSCLIQLRAAGYDLELVGDPDPNGYASHCGWHASQAGVVLKAANPIELLGLAELHRNAAAPLDEDYWWRVDGPNIVSELEAEWWRQWHGNKPIGQPV